MKIINFWKPIIVAIAILYGSITSSSNLNRFDLIDFEHFDKIVHFILYLALSITFFASIKKHIPFSKVESILVTLVLVISYGILMEVFQYYFTNDRSADVFDVVANTLGCISGIFVYPIVVKLKLTRYL